MSGRFGKLALDDRFHDRLRRISDILSRLMQRDQTAMRHGIQTTARGDVPLIEELVSLSNDPNRGMAKVHKLSRQLLHAYMKDNKEYAHSVLTDIMAAVSHVHEDDVLSAAQRMAKTSWH